jgi:hypothetical protein
VIYLILVVVLAVVVFVLARESRAYSVLHHFIYTEDPKHDISALPHYYAMVLHPGYWHLWTVDQWRAWVTRRTA